MKFTNQFMAVIFTVILGLTMSIDAHAKRLGGGKSIGKQSSSVTQKQALPSSTQTTPNSASTQPGATNTATKPAQPTPASTPAQPRKFGWGSMLGGLAAGLGIGWLLSHFGLGEAAASFFTGLIILMVVGMIGMWLFRRFATNNQAYKLSPAGGPTFDQQPFNERNTSFANSGGSNAVASAEQWVDQESFLENAKKMFVQLQEAADKQDLETLRDFTTPEMFSLIRAEFLERSEAFSTTQVLTLHAELFNVEKEGDMVVASIRFSGLIREDSNGPANHFEEVWNWIKPINGQTGWVLAGIQQ